MIDREKIIQGLEHCINEEECEGCVYYDDYYNKMEERHSDNKCPCFLDVLALLKEQEPVMLENQHKPYGNFLNANAPWISRCPKCGKKVEGKQTRYCKYCGQAVKWND